VRQRRFVLTNKEEGMKATQHLHDIVMPPAGEKFYSARIIERRDISDDLWVIRVDLAGEYRYEPGQYATLGLLTPEKHYERAYSIVSAPHEKFLEFFIELVPHGNLTPGYTRIGLATNSHCGKWPGDGSLSIQTVVAQSIFCLRQ
jgi:hypothetical protein